MRNKWKLAILAAACVGLLMSPAFAAESVTMVSWGGAYQEASRKALYEPVAKNLGITIREDTLSGLKDSRVQVQSGNVTWDIVEQWSNDCISGGAEGLFEPIDYGVVDTTGMDPALKAKHWVAGNAYYSTVLAWSKETYGENGPKNWADFWNVKKFPGKRALYKWTVTTMEIALMADGVPLDKVYEVLGTKEGADRALRKLEELKPHVAVWWGSGAQSASLIKDGEVDMLMIWNGRISSTIKDGAKAAFTWNEGILDHNCLTVLKGAPNKDLAMKVINGMLSPGMQANIPQHIDYGPVNPRAFGAIDTALAKTLPTAPKNAKVQLHYSAKFWVDHLKEMGPRFSTMIQE